MSNILANSCNKFISSHFILGKK
uniref:Uncharacterized protein n=1 Tax=Lepeophtheirus salmonis TaxID=72036 RepID=A0A0K2TDZ6_LEPSM